MLTRFCTIESFYFLQYIIITCWTESKTLMNFFLVLYFIMMILRGFLNLLRAFVMRAFVISGDEFSIIPMISRYFQVWKDIDEKFFKKILLQPDLLKLFFLKLFPLDLPARQPSLDKCYRRFCFYFISKKRFYCLSKGFVICDVTCTKMLSISLRWFEINFLFRWYVQNKSHFFFLILISI